MEIAGTRWTHLGWQIHHRCYTPSRFTNAHDRQRFYELTQEVAAGLASHAKDKWQFHGFSPSPKLSSVSGQRPSISRVTHKWRSQQRKGRVKSDDLQDIVCCLSMMTSGIHTSVAWPWSIQHRVQGADVLVV